MKKKPKIILVDYGLANNFGTHIEINKELKRDPELYNYILAHELGHSTGSAKLHDFLHDVLILNWKIVFKILFFVLRRPKIWFEFLPIQIKKNKIIYDKSMIILYGIASFLLVVLIILISMILKK